MLNRRNDRAEVFHKAEDDLRWAPKSPQDGKSRKKRPGPNGPWVTPFKPANVLATLYHALGIDSSLTFVDQLGRPRYILDDREPIRELL